MRRIWKICAVFMLLACSDIALSSPNPSSTSNVEMRQLQSLHFNIFFYKGQDSLAQFVLNAAIDGLPQIEDKVGYRLNGKLDMFLLRDPDIVNPTMEPMESANRQVSGGATAIIGNRIHLSIDLSFQEINLQVKRGIAKNLIYEMLYGGTAQERIKYATLLHLPSWFLNGLNSYCAVDWNEELDNQLRNALLHNHFKNLNKLSPQESTLLGHSLWRYIDQHKGENTIKRTLYSVRFSKKLENAFYFVFNQSSRELIDEWMNYQLQNYLQQERFLNPLKPEQISLKSKHDKILHYDLSPNANRIALSVYNRGQYSIQIWDRELETMEKWHVFGHKNISHQQLPHQALVRWKNDNELFLIKRKLINQHLYSSRLHLLDKNSIELVSEWSDLTINSFDWDGQGTLAFLGQSGGQSKIKLFSLITQQITDLAVSNEYWSDLSFSHNHQAILFTASVLRGEANEYLDWQKDVKVILIDHPESISNVTNTPDVNESYPVPISKTLITYVSDESGINNAFQLDLSSMEKHALTNYRLGIKHQKVNSSFTYLTELIHADRYDHLYISENEIVKQQQTLELERSFYRRQEAKQVAPPVQDSGDLSEIESDRVFQIEFPEGFGSDIPQSNVNGSNSSPMETQQIPFKNKLNVHSILTQVNNTNLLSSRFSPFLNPETQLVHRYGVLFGVELRDIQNQNRIRMGIRTFPTFNRWDLQLKYAYQKNNWLNSIDVWRQSNLITTNNSYQKNVGSHIAYTLGHRPNRNWIVLSQLNYRNEQFLELSTEAVSLTTNSIFRRNVGIQLRAQYENLLAKKTNSYHGFKGYAQAERQQNINNGTAFIEFQTDLRYGLPLTPTLSWMNRFHAATSSGAGRILYFMGGVENSKANGFKYLTYIFGDNNAYFMPVYGVRGHEQNVRNGNSFAYLNSEIRWELGKTVLRYPNAIQAVQNLMLVGFVDVGSAWYGGSPYSKDNPLNTQIITTPVFDIVRYNPQQPLVFGTGVGARTKLYSYFIKYDVAVGWDNSVWGASRHYFSLGKDF